MFLDDNEGMTKHILMAGLLVATLSGCASMATKWHGISYGDSKEDVISRMGDPEAFTMEGDREVLGWQMDAFATCAVKLSKEGKVEDKTCKDDSEARARDQRARYQAAMMYLQMQSAQPRPVYTPPPIQPYQMQAIPIRQTTHCTSYWIGNQRNTDCN